MANTSYFSAENSWKRLFFITGKTADEFYMDSGIKMNIEQAIWQELKRNGYERIVFFDNDQKLYCYDDESFKLLTKTTKEDSPGKANAGVSAEPRLQKGLRRGRNAHRMGSAAADTTPPSDMPQEGAVQQEPEDTVSEDQSWKAGVHSGVLVKNTVGGPLHLGMTDNTFVKRQMDAYMYNAAIKTAVVINDPTTFLHEFGSDPLHSLTAGYERLGSENQNIMIFIYTDNDLASIYEVKKMVEENKDALNNIINIPSPNAIELKNMLMYMKINYGLKIRLSELTEVAVALYQALQLSEQPVRIKELYTRLRGFEKEKLLDKDSCYELLGTKKPESAKEQLTKLIGMAMVKKKLASYETKDRSPLAALPYLTVSRLQPDLDDPDEKKEEEMLHVVLTGPPGVGKTTVAKLLGQLFFEMGYLKSGHVVETDRSELVGGYIGQTALLVRQKVEEAMGGVLFIDEVYALKRAGNSEADYGQEAIDTLCKLMDEYKGKFVVVAAGYPEETAVFIKSNPGLASRFKLKMNIEPYAPSEMCEILKFHAKKQHFRFSEELENLLPDFCENWVETADPEEWGNAREAVNLINDMGRAYSNDAAKETIRENDIEYGILDIRHIPKEFEKHLQPISESRKKVLENLQNMVGLANVKEMVNTIRNRMLSGRQSDPGHYIFIGNPGTGKTTVARYFGQIMRNLGMLKRGHVVEYTATDLMNEVFNRENNGNFVEVAKKALDGILFIDEAYLLEQDKTGRGESILGALLSYMENNHDRLCVIVAGYEDEMNDLIEHNPGYKDRFKQTIRFDNYTGEELTEILMGMLKAKGITANAEYREYALRALTRYVKLHGKEKDFGNARFIRNTFLLASLDAQMNRLISVHGEDYVREHAKECELTGADIPADMVRYTRTPLKKEDTRSAMEEIESMVGFSEVKEKLKNLLELRENAEKSGREDLLDDLNLHMVLRGNPGVGKTTVAKLIGKAYKEAGFLPRGHVVKVTRAELVAGYVGQTAIKTRKVIERAMGGVLFIDEAYMLKRSENSGNDFGQEAIDTILEQMTDHLGEFAIVAAGYPAEMNTFLDSNPGFYSRFGGDYLIPDYTAEELLRIFEHMCQNKKFYLEDDMKEQVKKIFTNMIAADLPHFANAREAENLEKSMRMTWTKNPVNRVDEATSETRSYYTPEHIPEQYREYLEDAPEKVTEEKEAFQISGDTLGLPKENFKYEEEYMDQTKSVVFIRTKRGRSVSNGSGSIITTDGYILTCNHVIDKAKEIQVRVRKAQDGEKAVWRKAKVCWADAKLDAAILKIPTDENYSPLPLRAADAETLPGEAIYLWGYPFGSRLSDSSDGLDASLFQGSVSSIQRKGGLSRINANMEAKRGCSGAPVFSKKDGTIIGILCGSQTEGDSNLVEEINYVLPVKYILENVIV